MRHPIVNFFHLLAVAVGLFFFFVWVPGFIGWHLISWLGK